MILVWICDDNKRMAVITSRFVNRAFSLMNKGVVVDTYFSGGEVIDTLKKDKAVPDIILLAVKMKSIQGFEVAEEFKRMHCHTILIFVSAYSQVFYEGLKYAPLGCIIKNYMNNEIEYYLLKALLLLEQVSEGTLPVSVSGRKVQLYVWDVAYLMSKNKMVVIYLLNGEMLNVRKSLRCFFEDQVGDDFIFLSRSLLVNRNCIRGICNRKVILVNGACLRYTNKLILDCY